jgi:hypothetical protein
LSTSDANHELSATLDSQDIAGIAMYLTVAVAHGEVSADDAERALLDWTHNDRLLDRAASLCPDRDAALLLHLASRHCGRAA